MENQSNKQWNVASKTLNWFRTREQWSDFALYFQAKIAKDAAIAAIERRHYKTAITKTTSALSRLDELVTLHPASSFLEGIKPVRNRSELMLAHALSLRKQEKQAMDVFKRVFQRILTQKTWRQAVRWIHLEELESFLELCQKDFSSFCGWTARRMLKAYPERSREFSKIKQVMGKKIGKLPKSPSFSYRTKVYKSKEKDDVAIEPLIDGILSSSWGVVRSEANDFLKEFPRSKHRGRVLFWLSRAYDRLGDDEIADQIRSVIMTESPFSFYAIQASFESKTNKLESFIDASLPQAIRRDPLVYPHEEMNLTQAEKLLSIGHYRAAASALQGLDRFSRWQSPFLIYLATLNFRSGAYLQNFRIVNELLKRGDRGLISTYGLRLVFPTPFLKTIYKEASKSEVDPLLVLSLTKQESAFTPEILSWAGAMGLMQLMPFTAIDVDPKVMQSDVTDIETNVRLGTRYIAGRIKQFEGNYVHALAGYNAGPNRVKKWKKKARSSWEMLQFVESIPFEETRNYVTSIMRNYYWYSLRVGGEKLENFDLFWQN